MDKGKSIMVGFSHAHDSGFETESQIKELDAMLDLAKFAAEARAKKVAARDKPEVYKLPNGTWTHRFSAHGGFADEATAATDLRFCREWGVK